GIVTLYSALFEFQEKVNELITSYNLLNGLIFTYDFNNRMKDESYTDTQTDSFNNIMMTKVKNLKRIPGTYNDFNNSIKPQIDQGPEETVIYLLKTYGYYLSKSNKLSVMTDN